MKTSRPYFFPALLLTALAVFSDSLLAQEAGGAPKAASTTNTAPMPPAAMSSQYEAMGRYPELARAGSPFNVKFLARVRKYQAENIAFFQNERWPVLLAGEVAAAGFRSTAPVTEPAPAPDPAPRQLGGNRFQGRTIAAPAEAPSAVHYAIQAGNTLQNKPYKWSGGHARLEDWGYDCSGSVSYVLRKAGLLNQALTSRGFASYGHPGPGRWITIYAGPGHAFMTVCGVRLDTGGRRGVGESGPRWNSQPRYAANFIMRHPPGF